MIITDQERGELEETLSRVSLRRHADAIRIILLSSASPPVPDSEIAAAFLLTDTELVDLRTRIMDKGIAFYLAADTMSPELAESIQADYNLAVGAGELKLASNHRDIKPEQLGPLLQFLSSMRDPFENAVKQAGEELRDFMETAVSSLFDDEAEKARASRLKAEEEKAQQELMHEAADRANETDQYGGPTVEEVYEQLLLFARESVDSLHDQIKEQGENPDRGPLIRAVDDCIELTKKTIAEQSTNLQTELDARRAEDPNNPFVHYDQKKIRGMRDEIKEQFAQLKRIRESLS